LISPIFTKIAERWSALDEAIRNIDTNKHMGAVESTDDLAARNERVALAKEKVRRERLIRVFKDKVAELEDELLLLDDVFRVSGCFGYEFWLRIQAANQYVCCPSGRIDGIE
jgi:hypothetical protein